MRKLLGLALFLVLFIANASQAAVNVVADYNTPSNFAGPTPAAGWSYSWNPLNIPLTTGTGQTLVANTANWTPLAFNSAHSPFETVATGALPHAQPGSFLSANSTSVKVGDTPTNAGGDGLSHYVILSYTFTPQQIASFGNNLVF